MKMSPPTYRVRIRGEWACFTRPELKTERVTYHVITPSAARGAVEAILWKPAIRWRVHRIAVLAPIKFAAVKRNEVNKVVPVKNARAMMRGRTSPTTSPTRTAPSATRWSSATWIITSRCRSP